MFEQTPFEDGVGVGTAGSSRSSASTEDFMGPDYRLRYDPKQSAAVCDRCGNVPTAMSRSQTASSSSMTSSLTSSLPEGRTDSGSNAGVLSAEPAYDPTGSTAGNPAERITGLAAFNSQGSLARAASTASAGKQTASVSQPLQRACACQDKQPTNGEKPSKARAGVDSRGPQVSPATPAAKSGSAQVGEETSRATGGTGEGDGVYALRTGLGCLMPHVVCCSVKGSRSRRRASGDRGVSVAMRPVLPDSICILQLFEV